MEIKSAVKNLFDQLRMVLEHVNEDQYKTPSVSLSGSTVGQHIRHSLEFFTCLLQGKSSGIVNYDNRKREASLEMDKMAALALLNELSWMVEEESCEKELILELSYSHISTDPIKVSSNFNRELVYNIEHAIHHLALIKIGMREVAPQISLPDGFGVANSTIRYQKQHEKA